MKYFKPCWSCGSKGRCYDKCRCWKCRNPKQYELWKNQNPKDYEAWLKRMRTPDGVNPIIVIGLLNIIDNLTREPAAIANQIDEAKAELQEIKSHTEISRYENSDHFAFSSAEINDQIHENNVNLCNQDNEIRGNKEIIHYQKDAILRLDNDLQEKIKMDADLGHRIHNKAKELSRLNGGNGMETFEEWYERIPYGLKLPLCKRLIEDGFVNSHLKFSFNKSS
jgi:hypothetical protein